MALSTIIAVLLIVFGIYKLASDKGKKMQPKNGSHAGTAANPSSSSTEAKAADRAPSAEATPPNELLAFRKGGSMWVDCRDLEGATALGFDKSLTASASGSQIEVIFNGDLIKPFLKETGGSLRCVSLSYTAREVVFTLYFSNAPLPEHSLRYTYNEYLKAEEMPPYTASDFDQRRMQWAALSRLTEVMPEAYMHNGKIYKDVHHYQLYK